jgi:hypothetical protein
MSNWALYIFLFILTLLGGILGFAMHYWRANFTMYPEKLTDNFLLDGFMSGHDMTFEKHVLDAKWDDNGNWDLYSFRNIAYYVISGAAAPLILAMYDWKIFKFLGDHFCAFMISHGNHSLLCY